MGSSFNLFKAFRLKKSRLSTIMASGGETQEEISTATTPDLLGYGFAAVVVVGGLMGFRKGSKQSLEAGLLAGGAIGFAADRVSKDPSNAYFGTGICGTLAGVMGWRYTKSKAFMPAGLVAGLSTAMAARYLYLQTTTLGKK